MTKENTTTKHGQPALYVGTYEKYNNGSIKGAWLQLEDYTNQEDFLDACRELHKDENDPEFMFQDFEGFPKALYSKSWIDHKIFDWINLGKHEKYIVELYLDNIDSTADFDTVIEGYAGDAATELEWVEDYVEEKGFLEGVPEILKLYFDYEAYLRYLKHSGAVSFAHDNTGVTAFWSV
tara:strand:+ start:76 stop:612 length:537 start_codon:yes stop_codon:yes gene_type:complete